MRTLLAIFVLAAAFGAALPQAASAQFSCMVLPRDADDNANGPIYCFTSQDDCFVDGGDGLHTCDCVREPACDGLPNLTPTPGRVQPDRQGTTELLNEAEKEDLTGPNRPARTELENPLGRNVTLPLLIGRVTRMLMGISGSLALVLFVYGGFLWLTSAGNMDKVKQGKKLFVSATLGLIVIFSAYVLVAQVFTILGL